MIKEQYLNTSGIILKNSRLKDTSANITVLTQGSGILEITRFGYNSKKNYSKSVLQPLNLTELYIEMKQDRRTIKDCVLSENFGNLKKDYKRTVCASELADSIIKLRVYDIKDYSLIFVLFKKFLEALNTQESHYLTLTAYFYFRLAWCMGISFDLDSTEEGSLKNLSISKNLHGIMKTFSEHKFADINEIDYITEREFIEFCEMYKKYTGYHFGNPIQIRTSLIGEE
ncbi:MAG: DNA repair protein RecO [Candidatus Delongbacteria bacterium]|nr:DNA repair protein RecO [Candidatus Delongbacteria bacterium]